MLIKELSQRTGVTSKTIRYYEDIGLMPPPKRAANNYRVYTSDAVDRLRFITVFRGLDFGLADIAQFLEARDQDQLACHEVLGSLEEHIEEIDRRIADLLALREALTGVHHKVQTIPEDNKCNEQCAYNVMKKNG